MAEPDIQTILEQMVNIKDWESLEKHFAPELLVTWAESLGSYLADQDLSADYARKMLAKMMKAEQQCLRDGFQISQDTRAHEDLFFLKPRLSYKVARASGTAQQGYDVLLQAYTSLLQVQSLCTAGHSTATASHDLWPEIRKVREFFQAIIAYHAARQRRQRPQNRPRPHPAEPVEEQET